MDYAIFPTDKVAVFNGYVRNSHHAWDLNGDGSGIDADFKAPCTLIVLHIDRYSETGYGNTVYFGTCDEYGNKTPVRCEDDVDRVLTFACTHINDDDLNSLNLYVGKIIKRNEVCYREGTTGKAKGAHIHLEVSSGWKFKKSTSRYEMADTEVNGKILIRNTFRILNSHVMGNVADGTTFKKTATRTVVGTSVLPIVREPIMRLTGSAARLRNSVVNGTVKTLIPNGSTFYVIDIGNKVESDGYRWGRGKYNGEIGYFQYDPAVMHLEGVTTKFNMKLTGSAARIRADVGSTIFKTVPNYGTIKVYEFLPDKKRDGYYWCIGKYSDANGTQMGYFQYDPAVMYPTTAN